MIPDPKLYTCKYCLTKFKRDGNLARHRCKTMDRIEEFKTPDGYVAWLMYCEWMRENRRVVPKSTAFIQSSYYTSFIKFSRFSRSVQLPNYKEFIRLMCKNNIGPKLWNDDRVYALYLDHLDRSVSPKISAEITINSILKVSEINKCDTGDVFNTLTTGEVIAMLRKRRLSPWILLNSGKFKEFFINKANTDEKIIIESIIRPESWEKKFDKNPDTVTLMKRYVNEMKL